MHRANFCIPLAIEFLDFGHLGVPLMKWETGHMRKASKLITLYYSSGKLNKHIHAQRCKIVVNMSIRESHKMNTF
jgi:hypothetical protein